MTARRRDAHAFAVGAVTVALLLWAWSAGLDGPYHFDDYVTPQGDPASQSLTAWSHYLPVTLRPVAKLSYAAEAEAGWSDQPAPRRAVSIALQAMAAALFVLLIRRLSPGIPLLGAAFLAALWFVHPVQADSILMLSGRPAVLSGLLLVAALLAMEWPRPWLAAALFVLACLSRETALAGLLPLAVLSASRPGATLRSSLRELAPVLLGGVLVMAWLLTTPRYVHLAEFSFLGRPFWGSLAAQVGAVPVGLGLLVNPSAISIDYGIPLPPRMTSPLFLLGAVCYLSAAAGVGLLLRRSRAAAVGLAIWLAALLPTQSVVPKLDALTNRPLTLALLGLLLAAAPALAAAARRIRASSTVSAAGNPGDLRHAAVPLAAACCALALLLALTTVTLDRGRLFRSELSLWRDAALKSRTNARPHLQYAVLLHKAGHVAEARDALSAARRIDPFSSDIALFSRLQRHDEVVP